MPITLNPLEASLQNPSAVYSKQDFTNKNITLNNSGYTQQYLTKTHGKHEGLNTQGLTNTTESNEQS